MKIFNFSRFFANNSTNASRKKADKQRRGRTCRIEELEGREMLSVTPWTLDDDNLAGPPASLYGETVIENVSIAEQQTVPPLSPLGNTSWTNQNLTITQENFHQYADEIANLTSIADSTIIANGVTLDFANCVELRDVNLTAQGGGVIKFPKVTSYSGTEYAHKYWNATGTDSRIELTALTTVSQSRGYTLYLQTRSSGGGGGVVDVSRLVTVDTMSRFCLSPHHTICFCLAHHFGH